MILCRVTGDVVSTVKEEHLRGQRLLVCQPVQLDLATPIGTSFLAIDVVQAGVSDLVLCIREGSGARLILGDDSAPLEAVIVAIVDDLEHEDPAAHVGASVIEQERALDAAGEGA